MGSDRPTFLLAVSWDLPSPWHYLAVEVSSCQGGVLETRVLSILPLASSFVLFVVSFVLHGLCWADIKGQFLT